MHTINSLPVLTAICSRLFEMPLLVSSYSIPDLTRMATPPPLFLLRAINSVWYPSKDLEICHVSCKAAMSGLVIDNKSCTLSPFDSRLLVFSEIAEMPSPIFPRHWGVR